MSGLTVQRRARQSMQGGKVLCNSGTPSSMTPGDLSCRIRDTLMRCNQCLWPDVRVGKDQVVKIAFCEGDEEVPIVHEELLVTGPLGDIFLALAAL